MIRCSPIDNNQGVILSATAQKLMFDLYTFNMYINMIGCDKQYALYFNLLCEEFIDKTLNKHTELALEQNTVIH